MDFTKSPDPEPPARDDDDDPSPGPARDRGPSQRDLQRQRWGAQLMRQGDHALKRKKWDEAIGHFQKAADLGAAGAWSGLAAAQHKKGLLWFKQKHYLAGRWKVEEAARNDPNQPIYQETLAFMHEKWCRLHRPLIPQNLSGGNDELRFHETAEAICTEKSNLAIRGDWKCDWTWSCW